MKKNLKEAFRFLQTCKANKSFKRKRKGYTRNHSTATGCKCNVPGFARSVTDAFHHHPSLTIGSKPPLLPLPSQKTEFTPRKDAASKARTTKQDYKLIKMLNPSTLPPYESALPTGQGSTEGCEVDTGGTPVHY